IIVSGGYLPNSDSTVPAVYQGTYAAMLQSNTGDLNFADFSEISQSVVIPSGFTNLQFYYCASLQIGNHGLNQDAYILVAVNDGTSDIYSARYDASSLASIMQLTADNAWYYISWQPVVIPLAAYI